MGQANCSPNQNVTEPSLEFKLPFILVEVQLGVVAIAAKGKRQFTGFLTAVREGKVEKADLEDLNGPNSNMFP